ncbi:TVP38/TMEM64 family protein [Thioalkalivibrio sp. AKL19]|uniref:TVP38/TMEM64 family protein n=1 Tax=Thioalkalivibrio sp. AKL19 TaxID=1266914 RepID=UPI0003F5ABA1|nr:TVP38/TMEM64 family protein [Thioalkalivibrio sp. AKL19]
MNRYYWGLVVALVGLVAVWLVVAMGPGLDLETLQVARLQVEDWRVAHPFVTAWVFFLLYMVVAAFSVPGIVVMTLAGGALFGVVWGTVLSSLASTLGATLTFVVARALARDAVQRRYKNQLGRINAGFEREGAFYLFALRMIPVFPFLLVNAGMGLLPIRIWTYFWVSLVGMLPATAVFANAGTQLGRLDGIEGILSPVLVLSLVATGLFPLLARWLVNAVRRRRARLENPGAD